jgi:hypothetical protein
VTPLEIFVAVPDCDIRRVIQRFEAHVKAYDYRNGAHRLPALDSDAELYLRRRDPSDAVWPPGNAA